MGTFSIAVTISAWYSRVWSFINAASGESSIALSLFFSLAPPAGTTCSHLLCSTYLAMLSTLALGQFWFGKVLLTGKTGKRCSNLRKAKECVLHKQQMNYRSPTVGLRACGGLIAASCPPPPSRGLDYLRVWHLFPVNQALSACIYACLPSLLHPTVWF